MPTEAVLIEFERLDALLDRTLLDPSTWAGALVYALLFTLASVLLSRALSRGVRHLAARGGSAVDHAALAFFVRVAQFLVVAFALALYAHVVPALHKLSTALLTGASLASIVVGLAAQNTLGNVVSGFLLVLYRPFRAGDMISVTTPTGVETGAVEDLSLGYTTLLTFGNRRVVVPNSLLTNESWVNLTSVDPHVVVEVAVPVAYTADLGAARALLIDLAEADPRVQKVLGCPVSALGDSSVTLLLRAECASALAARDARWALTEAAKLALDANGIEIPYPYTNVVVHQPCTAVAAVGTSAEND